MQVPTVHLIAYNYMCVGLPPNMELACACVLNVGLVYTIMCVYMCVCTHLVCVM